MAIKFSFLILLFSAFTFGQDWVPEQGAYYRIVFRHSGKCIRPTNAVLGNTVAEQWEVDPTDQTQLWEFQLVNGNYYVAVNKASGKAFDIFASTPNDVVGVWTQHNGLNQQIRFSASGAQSGYYFIFDNRANKTLDVTGNSQENGARIISYPQKSSGTANQEVQFVKETPQAFVPHANVYYRMIFRHSRKCIRPIGGSLGNVHTEQWQIDEADESQLWRFEQVNGEYYVGINKASGKAFDIFDETPNDIVGVWDQHNGLNQQIKFSPSGARTGFYFIFDNRADQTLDVTGNSQENGARIISYPQKSGGTANQEVQFVKETTRFQFMDESGLVKVQIKKCDWTGFNYVNEALCTVDPGWVMVSGGAEIWNEEYPGALLQASFPKEDFEYNTWTARSVNPELEYKHKLRAYTVGLKLGSMDTTTLINNNMTWTDWGADIGENIVKTAECPTTSGILIGGGSEVVPYNAPVYLTESRPSTWGESWTVRVLNNQGNGVGSLRSHPKCILECPTGEGWPAGACLEIKNRGFSSEGPSTGVYATETQLVPAGWVSTGFGAMAQNVNGPDRYLNDLIPLAPGGAQGSTVRTKTHPSAAETNVYTNLYQILVRKKP